MKTKEELMKTKAYWLVKIQCELADLLQKHLVENNLSVSDFAEKTEYSEKYIKYILEGGFDFNLSKLIELCLCMNIAPNFLFEKFESESK